jgi:hypothetical protein
MPCGAQVARCHPVDMLATSTETRYMIREAVLGRSWSGYAWTVRFAPVAGTSDADEVVVLVSPRHLDEMTFSHPYTLGEIRDLEEYPS